METARQYPVDIVTYLTAQLTVPPEVILARDNTEKAGFYVLPITGDKFNIIGRSASAFASPQQARKQDKAIKVYQAPYKHLRDITMPKMNEYMIKHPSAKGFFIAEGDHCLKKGYTFDDFLKEYGDTQKITWMGYKKILRVKGKIDYIVGNFMIYVPRSQMPMLTEEFEKQKREIYSDRFFTRLVQQGKVVLAPKSIAGEIAHVSAVAGGKVRVADCHLNTELPAYERIQKTQQLRQVKIQQVTGGKIEPGLQDKIKKNVMFSQGKLHFLPKDFRDLVFGDDINPGKQGTVKKKIKVKPEPSSLASKILKDLKKK